MSIRDELGERMKSYYESSAQTKLTRRTPVAIRIDGKAFHTFAKGLKKPFDDLLSASMVDTMEYLCKNIQGCVFGYTQSDEITLILVDYQNLNTSAWFDYKVQKICSVAASMATMRFNKIFAKKAEDYIDDTYEAWNVKDDDYKYCEILRNKVELGAMFDARCFNIPKEEVANLLVWRQVDAIRNSVQMVGRASFSHNSLNNMSSKKIKDMLVEHNLKPWEEYEDKNKFGTFCTKKDEKSWLIDSLKFTENRKLINDAIIYDEKVLVKSEMCKDCFSDKDDCKNCTENPKFKGLNAIQLNFMPYKPTCPQGYTDCVYDPAYIKFFAPGSYAKMYGTMTPEEASAMNCDINANCYDDEDK